MKKIYLLFILIALSANAQEAFITTWDISAEDLTIKAPINDSPNNNYTIDFGDGTILTSQTSSVNHTYANPGTYTVTVSGNFNRINIQNSDRHQILSVQQWGNTQWISMENAFKDCDQLTLNATDTPDLSQVTSTRYMLKGTTSFNQPINNWDVSNVTDMSFMFAYSAYNQPLDNWDVSNVTNMSNLFSFAEDFNQPLDNWDVSNVTDISNMFEYSSYNKPLNSWDVSSVTNMSNIFRGCVHFNQPLNNWNVSNVTNMLGVFQIAITFNQPINNWDVSNVIYMGNLFHSAEAFDQDISDWTFNENVHFENTFSPSPNLFMSGSMSTNNYDALLLRFVQLGLQNKTLISFYQPYCDSGIRNYLIENLGWTFVGDIQDDECAGNNIVGSITYDENVNGCDAEDLKMGNFLVKAANGQFSYSTFSSAGEYDLKVRDNTYSVSLLNVPNYYTVTPPSSTVNFTGFGNEEELNFCLTANEAINDLNITLLPIGWARPGFESHYQLVAENLGTQTITGASVSFTYNETIQSFTEASQTPVSTTANQLTFDLGTIMPLETKIIDITMETFTPPTINGGETINFVASITPDTNDYTPANNTYNLDQVVVNSFDPNDKTILQGDEIYMEQTEGYLDYVIRFQNTGTASAIIVRIEDVLHDNLDWTTFKPVTSSHDYRVEITDGNQVEFIFDNINLPHEAADEPGSHGFVAYKIKTVEDIAIGDVITGTAGIFFDYNLPIITNSADTEVIEFMGVNEFSIKNVTLYPNPASTILYLQAENGIDVEGVKVFNLQGSELISLKQQTESINVQNLSAGIYLVIVQTNEGVSKHRLIKK